MVKFSMDSRFQLLHDPILTPALVDTKEGREDFDDFLRGDVAYIERALNHATPTQEVKKYFADKFSADFKATTLQVESKNIDNAQLSQEQLDFHSTASQHSTIFNSKGELAEWVESGFPDPQLRANVVKAIKEILRLSFYSICASDGTLNARMTEHFEQEDALNKVYEKTKFSPQRLRYLLVDIAELKLTNALLVPLLENDFKIYNRIIFLLSKFRDQRDACMRAQEKLRAEVKENPTLEKLSSSIDLFIVKMFQEPDRIYLFPYLTQQIERVLASVYGNDALNKVVTEVEDWLSDPKEFPLVKKPEVRSKYEKPWILRELKNSNNPVLRDFFDKRESKETKPVAESKETIGLEKIRSYLSQNCKLHSRKLNTDELEILNSNDENVWIRFFDQEFPGQGEKVLKHFLQQIDLLPRLLSAVPQKGVHPIMPFDGVEVDVSLREDGVVQQSVVVHKVPLIDANNNDTYVGFIRGPAELICELQENGFVPMSGGTNSNLLDDIFKNNLQDKIVDERFEPTLSAYQKDNYRDEVVDIFQGVLKPSSGKARGIITITREVSKTEVKSSVAPAPTTPRGHHPTSPKNKDMQYVLRLDFARAFNATEMGDDLKSYLASDDKALFPIEYSGENFDKTSNDHVMRVAGSHGETEFKLDGSTALRYGLMGMFQHHKHDGLSLSPFDESGKLVKIAQTYFSSETQIALQKVFKFFHEQSIKLLLDRNDNLRLEALKEYFVDQNGKEILTGVLEQVSVYSLRDALFNAAFQTMQLDKVGYGLYRGMLGAIYNAHVAILDQCRSALTNLRTELKIQPRAQMPLDLDDEPENKNIQQLKEKVYWKAEEVLTSMFKDFEDFSQIPFLTILVRSAEKAAKENNFGELKRIYNNLKNPLLIKCYQVMHALRLVSKTENAKKAYAEYFYTLDQLLQNRNYKNYNCLDSFYKVVKKAKDDLSADNAIDKNLYHDAVAACCKTSIAALKAASPLDQTMKPAVTALRTDSENLYKKLRVERDTSGLSNLTRATFKAITVIKHPYNAAERVELAQAADKLPETNSGQKVKRGLGRLCIAAVITSIVLIPFTGGLSAVFGVAAAVAGSIFYKGANKPKGTTARLLSLSKAAEQVKAQPKKEESNAAETKSVTVSHSVSEQVGPSSSQPSSPTSVSGKTFGYTPSSRADAPKTELKSPQSDRSASPDLQSSKTFQGRPKRLTLPSSAPGSRRGSTDSGAGIGSGSGLFQQDSVQSNSAGHDVPGVVSEQSASPASGSSSDSSPKLGKGRGTNRG